MGPVMAPKQVLTSPSFAKLIEIRGELVRNRPVLLKVSASVMFCGNQHCPTDLTVLRADARSCKKGVCRTDQIQDGIQDLLGVDVSGIYELHQAGELQAGLGRGLKHGLHTSGAPRGFSFFLFGNHFPSVSRLIPRAFVVIIRTVGGRHGSTCTDPQNQSPEDRPAPNRK